MQSIEKSLNDLRTLIEQNQTQTPTQNDLISPEEACELLGISPVTLHRWEKQNKLKVYGIGGKRYLKRSEIEESLTLKEKAS
tara:strand:+ start:28452 stop:28697 length:246 start_codon:yes stop_codon:yes gene_type:complete